MKKKCPGYTLFLFLLLICQSMLVGQMTTIHQFSGTPDGNNPWGTVVSDGTYLYGMSYAGGANNLGCIYKILPDGTGYTNLFDFADTSTGTQPWGSLLYDGTYLYGMTEWGGASDEGALFKIKTDGTGFVKLLNFSSATIGATPQGSLISDGTFLYGMTVMGGANSTGTIFKIMPDGAGFVNLLDFNGSVTGINPYGDLFYDGTFLYGMTYMGGANDFGTLFKIMPDGSGFVNLMDFDSTTNGCNPTGSLISDGTFLYGMTNGGGANGMGTLFKIMPDGSSYANILDFAGATNGNLPRGSLLLEGNYLYGFTEAGGIYGLGTLFKIKTDGSGYVKLFDFSGIADGSNPYSGSLIADGQYLYGVTLQGGASDMGTIFKYQYCAPTDVHGHVSYSGGDVTNGFAVIYTYDTTAAFDTLQIQPLDISGNYHFSNVPAGDYLIKIYNDTIAFSTITSTYFGDEWVWDSAAVLTHDCIGTDTANVQMIELNLGGGLGLFHGQIIEGFGYGRSPGDPISGIHVLLGITGTSEIAAETVTDVNGGYTFASKALGNYTIYVDIPGLERNATHIFTADALNNQILCLDYIVDSVSIAPMNCGVGINSISENQNNFIIYPNPLRDQVFVDYVLHQDSYVELDIYNILGVKVQTIVKGDQHVGEYHLNVPQLELRSGIYFVSLSIDEKTLKKRIIVKE